MGVENTRLEVSSPGRVENRRVTGRGRANVGHKEFTAKQCKISGVKHSKFEHDSELAGSRLCHTQKKPGDFQPRLGLRNGARCWMRGRPIRNELVLRWKICAAVT